MLDCLIVGGGPAGLTAGLYLQRFRRSALVVDAGQSRARWIPRSHNVPGHVAGIGGTALLGDLRAHADRYGLPRCADRIVALQPDAEGFRAIGEHGAWRARTVMLATGVVDRMPALRGRRRAIAAGVVRLCPVCDAYEARGRRIAVYVRDTDAVLGHVRFLRTYSSDVCAVIATSQDGDASSLHAVRRLGIDTIVEPVRIVLGRHGCVVQDASRVVRFDLLYVALGVDARSELATALGADRGEHGELIVDAHMRTKVSGLYAIGDVAEGLNQIVTAMGQAAVAASAIHRQLPWNPHP